jgi:Ca2+-binding RTX toxin-like protein
MGRDWLDGGLGADELWGGIGSDTFIISPGGDWIVDFNAEQGDRIGFTSSNSISSQQTPAGLQIDTDIGSITLLGIDHQNFDFSTQIVQV